MPVSRRFSLYFNYLESLVSSMASFLADLDFIVYNYNKKSWIYMWVLSLISTSLCIAPSALFILELVFFFSQQIKCHTNCRLSGGSDHESPLLLYQCCKSRLSARLGSCLMCLQGFVSIWNSWTHLIVFTIVRSLFFHWAVTCNEPVKWHSFIFITSTELTVLE